MTSSAPTIARCRLKSIYKAKKKAVTKQSVTAFSLVMQGAKGVLEDEEHREGEDKR